MAKHDLTIVIPPSDESERFYHDGSQATSSEMTSVRRSVDPKASEHKVTIVREANQRLR